MRNPAPATDLLFVVMGSPHQGELVTTLLRLVAAALAQRRTVQVWACGYAAQLTQVALDTFKPTDLLDRHRQDPTSAAVIAELVATHPGRLHWYGCRTCGAHRGATEHVPGVRLRAPHRFADHVAAATKTVFMGTA